MKPGKRFSLRTLLRTLRVFFAFFAAKALDHNGRKKAAKAGMLLAAFVSVGCVSQTSVPEGQIDQIFSRFKSSDSPGVAVLVIKDGSIVFERGYGVVDLRSSVQH
jgi:CubicO group peptidase (beta-lactamase class C family)